MGIFKRMKDITKASLHEALDKLEDPVVMLNQYLRDMEQEINCIRSDGCQANGQRTPHAAAL